MEATLRILDIKEKDSKDVKPPSFPIPTSTATGFPQHKTRTRVSAFKRQRQAAKSQSQSQVIYSSDGTVMEPHRAPLSGNEGSEPETKRTGDVVDDQRRAIDEENRAVLDSMSPDEIAAAQRELLSGLDPKTIQMLLRRANLDEKQEESSSPSPFDPPAANVDSTSARQAPSATKPPEIRLNDEAREQEHTEQKSQRLKLSDGSNQKKKSVTVTAPPAPLAPNSTNTTTNTTHFPRHPDPVDDLDPSDPNFLEALHTKYFPNLPADPSKLAWMAPLPTPDSAADRESPYYPGQSSLPVSQLRFDFRGALVPPSISRQVPVTAGLHHHGEAPEAAGYTIPELARLARSSVPGQRCIAFRTLGRVLFRLGKGEWGVGQGGRTGEDEDDLAFALWRLVQENRVLDSLGEAAGVEDGVGHQSARAYAIEAIWLFEKGGWKERWRGL